MDIVTLHRQGLSQRAIARKLGVSRNTVKKYLDDPGLVFTKPPVRQRTSLLDPYMGNIQAWLAEDGFYRATLIYDRLAAMGFLGSYEIVKRKVRELKDEFQKVAYLRFSRPSRATRLRWTSVNSRLSMQTGVWKSSICLP